MLVNISTEMVCDVCSVMRASKRQYCRLMSRHPRVGKQIRQPTQAMRRVMRQYMDSAKQTFEPRGLEGWGGARPVFASDYSSFRSPLEEVNAIIATQV